MDVQTTPALDFESAAARLKGIVHHTPLVYNRRLSEKYECQVFLKREDQQVVRSYKIRGAYNKISSLSDAEQAGGVVCASAGNHAQGVALSCRLLGIKGVIFMPEITPKQKVSQTTMFGEGWIEIVLRGDTFDDCQQEALAYTSAHGMAFIPPFDDQRIVEGQGTVGVELYHDLPDAEVVIMPVGGGGLAAGMGTYLRSVNPEIELIGVEPLGAPSMKKAFEAGEPVTLPSINRFIDGAAVKRIGQLTYTLCKPVLDEVLLIPEGKACSAILKLYNEDAIVAEPAGAMPVAALDLCRSRIKGKKVVCIISGGNNDIDRMQEIKELSLLYEGLKHYFIIRFPQRPGALRLFVNNVLGPSDDITRFEFIKKTERESGPALVGIELKSADDYCKIVERMNEYKFDFKELNQDQILFEYLV